MYSYRSRRSIGAGSIFFIVLFILVVIGGGYLFFLDKGRFWDILPIICIPAAVISLILIIVYLVRKNVSGYIFIMFFIIFLSGIVLSSLFGPFALNRSAKDNFDNKLYNASIKEFKEIVENYPNSRYADDSLKGLAYSYYFNSNFEDSIFYFKKAIDENIISNSDLEVKKIFVDSFIKVADKYFEQKEYGEAGKNYLDAVVYYKEIKQNFPDSNDAFIAEYKIPEYLYKAALSLNYAKDYTKALEFSDEIAANYPEGDYYERATELIINSRIQGAMSLKEERDNKNAIVEFLKILDLKKETQDKYGYTINYQTKTFFQDIPVYIINETANELYSQSSYEKALFLYDILIGVSPDLEADLISAIVTCKINLIKKADFEQLVPSEPSGFFSKEGYSKITIENKMGFGISIYFGGSQYNIVRLAKDEKTEIELQSGDYEIVVEFEPENRLPLYGKNTYAEKKKYREVFKPAEEK
ncbi:MAG: outer membrane protein assembly factor BamD [Actinobacteria bacterium]|nr:outer membrane protein assembly factor BamD [Actinomycetota bacterium]